MAPEAGLNLPPLVVSQVDIGRLLREIDNIDESLLQLKLRKSGSSVKLPKTTALMDQIISLNAINLLHETDRKRLRDYLQLIKDNAPLIHISFSADPSTAFLEKLMVWLRREIDPYVLMTVGLQPSIGAGCILRTNNRYFDFSLKRDFENKRDMLISKLVQLEPNQAVAVGDQEAVAPK